MDPGKGLFQIQVTLAGALDDIIEQRITENRPPVLQIRLTLIQAPDQVLMPGVRSGRFRFNVIRPHGTALQQTDE